MCIQGPDTTGVSSRCVGVRALVRAPSVDVSSNLYLEVHAQDSSGCRCIWLFYNQDAYNQDVYTLQMLAFKVHITIIIKMAGMGGPCACARHSVKHLTKGISFNPHN